MKKAAIYARVSTPDQHIETQLYQLRELAARRGFKVVHEYTDVGVFRHRHYPSRQTELVCVGDQQQLPLMVMD